MYPYTDGIFHLLQNKLKIGLMHQSFVSTAPLGAGNNEAFNFSIFKALKARHRGVRLDVNSLLKASAIRRLTIMWNNSWKLFYHEGEWVGV